MKEHVKAATEPMRPVVQHSRDGIITINCKKHQLPTRVYLLKEYADLLEEIGTIPGGEYHIQQKKDYKPVQHPL